MLFVVRCLLCCGIPCPLWCEVVCFFYVVVYCLLLLIVGCCLLLVVCCSWSYGLVLLAGMLTCQFVVGCVCGSLFAGCRVLVVVCCWLSFVECRLLFLSLFVVGWLLLFFLLCVGCVVSVVWDVCCCGVVFVVVWCLWLVVCSCLLHVVCYVRFGTCGAVLLVAVLVFLYVSWRVCCVFFV